MSTMHTTFWILPSCLELRLSAINPQFLAIRQNNGWLQYLTLPEMNLSLKEVVSGALTKGFGEVAIVLPQRTDSAGRKAWIAASNELAPLDRSTDISILDAQTHLREIQSMLDRPDDQMSAVYLANPKTDHWLPDAGLFANGNELLRQTTKRLVKAYWSHARQFQGLSWKSASEKLLAAAESEPAGPTILAAALSPDLSLEVRPTQTGQQLRIHLNAQSGRMPGDEWVSQLSETSSALIRFFDSSGDSVWDRPDKFSVALERLRIQERNRKVKFSAVLSLEDIGIMDDLDSTEALEQFLSNYDVFIELAKPTAPPATVAP